MQKWAIGVDLGGTKIEVAIVNDDGKLLDRLRIPTESPNSPDEIIDNIISTIKKILTQHPDVSPSAIGIGVAGQIDKNNETVVYAPNLGWHNVNLQQAIFNKLHIPTFVCNDVKAAAWGEWLYGAGADSNNLVCIFIGTGIGGAIISNGQMLEGCNNTAGEIGHITLQLNGPVCHCGNTGCFEALAGGWALQRDAQLAVTNDTKKGATMLELVNGDIKAINGKTVTDAAQKGDVLANELIDNLTATIAAGIASVINLLGPCRVILGGGIIEGMPEIIARAEEQVKVKALKAAMQSVKLMPAKLHNDSGVTGAATYALHHIKQLKPTDNERNDH